MYFYGNGRTFQKAKYLKPLKCNEFRQERKNDLDIY